MGVSVRVEVIELDEGRPAPCYCAGRGPCYICGRPRNPYRDGTAGGITWALHQEFGDEVTAVTIKDLRVPGQVAISTHLSFEWSVL